LLLHTQIPYSYFPATFAMFIVKERVSNSRHLQSVSGVGSFTYWSSAYVWDMLNFLIVVACTLIIMVLFDSASFIGTWGRFGSTALLLILYACAAVPFSYLLSFSFNTHASAQVGAWVWVWRCVCVCACVGVWVGGWVGGWVWVGVILCLCVCVCVCV
jgi:hypothetical protein